jgi:CMP/dCMP kinase
MYRHIAINGELGSGKSSVARYLAKKNNMNLISTGDVQRTIAASLNLSTLETNLRAEYDNAIDDQVDRVTRDLADSSNSIIFDSRMAWKFVPSAFRVHLIVDPAVASRRLYRERSSAVEGYVTVEEAKKAAEERYRSERRRFLARYGVDVSLLQNYHLVVDSSDASVEEIADEIGSAWWTSTSTNVSLRISPKRVLPGRDPEKEIAIPSGRPALVYDPAVAYVRPFIYVLQNQLTISQAIQDDKSLINAILLAEDSQEVEQGISAAAYLRTKIRRNWIEKWEEIHSLNFETYPELMPA